MISYVCLLGYLVNFHMAGGQDNLIQKIKGDIRVSMSEKWSNWSASNAIDGDERTLAEACSCCAATVIHGAKTWWRLNLGRQYLIKSIIFIGRSDKADVQSRGFSVYNGFSNSSTQQLLDKNTATYGYHFTIPLNPPVVLEHLEVSRQGVLAICELKLEEDECSSGLTGYPCEQCGYCEADDICDPTTGECPNGCKPGYTGTSCQEQCAIRRFGKNCQSICHCQNNAICNYVNGSCPKNMCAPGWKGLACDTECDGGRFGVNCMNECHCHDQKACDIENGSCPSGSCAKGWKGSTCSAKCPGGTFGQNCLSICHCKNNETCNHVNGSCPNDLCAPGWIGLDCNTECDDGTFGLKCQNNCHCRDDVDCEKASGRCPLELCASGWKDSNCSTSIYILFSIK